MAAAEAEVLELLVAFDQRRRILDPVELLPFEELREVADPVLVDGPLDLVASGGRLADALAGLAPLGDPGDVGAEAKELGAVALRTAGDVAEAADLAQRVLFDAYVVTHL